MYNVYSQCSRCLAWLGEIDPEFSVADAKAALDLILFLSDKDEKSPISNSISSADTPTFKAYLRALASVGYAKNPWWTRIWTVQEAILPREILFHWGPLQVPWGRVGGALNFPRYKWLLVRPLSYQHGIFKTWPLTHYVQTQYAIIIWIHNAHVRRDSAFDAAIRWRGRQATVPHDKVFGLRGLWDPNVEMPNTDKCSYETSVAELYSAFTIDILLDENSLALLALDPRVERGKRTRDIPNWATDMNDSVEYGVDRYYRSWGDKQIYNACGENRLDKQALTDATADPNHHFNVDPNHHFNVLGLTGIMIDTVDVLAPVRLTKGNFETIPDVVISQTLRDWMDLARSRNRTGNFSDEAFHRLVIGGAMRDSEQEFKKTAQRG
ncbi:uncharacterized protein EAF02_003944 [Botrytis sinoallii]|uniref:uncharacterized protein n=1 Tax=Botrytis sinoallii TaxID=1463999 RepID=UPI0018FFA6AC|nr:uncharacterized protein EAF02_003944 [Botrytis sinoallii]KAF7885435.1 hypothetical protein EAF02_003944 [Botrytis sinoallii]